MLDNEWVSVIIVTWNSTEYFEKLIESLRSQTRPAQEIVIIDNDSRDFVVLKEMVVKEGKLPLKLIPSVTNLGFAAANNLGIKYCERADYIVLLNPDAFPEPHWLEKLLIATRKYPDFSFFSSRQMQPGGILLDGAGDQLLFWGKPYRRGYGKALTDKYLTDTPVFSACAAASMYKRSVLSVVDGFDQDFFCYMEDVDLSFRLQLQGFRCMYVADAVVTHIGSASLGKRSDFSVYYGQRNLIFCFFKNMPIICLLFFLPFHLTANMFYLFGAIFIGKFGIVFSAKKDALLSIAKVFSKRRVVQRERSISLTKLCALFARAMFNR